MRPEVGENAELLYSGLGPWRRADGEATDWLLLLLCEAIAAPLDELDEIIRDVPLVSGAPAELPVVAPGWSAIVDADRAPARFLPWLGQFVGVRLPGGLTEDDQRQTIRETGGFQRGTVASIVAAVQPYLTGHRTVVVVERDTSPYHYTVRVYEAEVGGDRYSTLGAKFPTYAELDAAFDAYEDHTAATDRIAAAVQASKPGGLIAVLSIVSGATYAELAVDFPTYAELDAGLGDYDDQRIHLPGG